MMTSSFKLCGKDNRAVSSLEPGPKLHTMQVPGGVKARFHNQRFINVRE